MSDYYDIEFDVEATLQDSTVYNIFYVKNLKQRKLFLNDDITQDSVSDIIMHIMQINAEDKAIPYEKRQPILLYITSSGGSVDAGFGLIDAILNSKTPVYTINVGFQYSMGFLIGLAGHKRFATPNARFLMHDGSSFVWDSGAKAQDQMEFNKRSEERIKQYIMSRSRLTEEEYASKYRIEWYMFAGEAKDKGFVDFIIGEDCDIDEVI